MKKQIIFPVAIVLALILAVFLALLMRETNGSATILRGQKDVLSYSDLVYNPLFRDESISESKLSMQENGIDYTNYWVMSSVGITSLLNNDMPDWGELKEILGCLMGTFDRNGYFPRPEYDEYEYGWVSCMDAPIIALFAELMHERTGEEVYREFVDDLAEYMLKDVSEHGYVAEIDGEKWLFEYAHTKTDKETGSFVLNGSLLGTLGTAMLARAIENQDLLDLVESQTRLYQQMMPQFWYENDTWCYYALRDNVVNQPHYVIFEIRILQALAEVTGVNFYQEEATRRVDLLKNYYRMYIYIENGEENYIFMRGGAPHYYYTDIYNSELVFYNKDGVEVARHTQSGNDAENSCMFGIYPEGATRVEWNIVPNVPWSLEMGDLQIIRDEEPDTAGITMLDTQWNASADGLLSGQYLSVDSERSEETRCNLVGTFQQPVEVDPNYIYAIELNNTSEYEFSTNIVLYDSEGVAISRYLKSILPGKNLLVFSPIGFSNYGRTPIENIESFNLRIYTVGKENTQAEISIGDVVLYDNSGTFARAIGESEYKILDWGA